MAQFARPSSDISTTGWTSVPGPAFYTSIDETPADDSDYVYASSASTLEVKLASISAPGAGKVYVVFRYRSAPYLPATSPTVDFVENTTVLATVNPGATNVFTDYVWDVSATPPSTWNNLRLRFRKNTVGTFYVSQAYLQAPDAGGGSGGFTATDSLAVIGVIDWGEAMHSTGHPPPNEIVNFGDDSTGGAKVVRYAQPTDSQDAATGAVCARSGLWFPGRMIVTVAGQKYGAPFAPIMRRSPTPDPMDGFFR